MQPTFNPWLGYFDLIDYVDTFVFLDHVQLTKRSWQVRNKIKVNNKEYMFSIPIKKQKSRDETLLCEAEISFENFDFREKLFALLKQNYKNTPFYSDLENEIKDIVFYDTNLLSDYNINFICSICKLLNIQTNFLKSSQMKNINGKKGDLIFNIAQEVNITEYISPIGSKDYLDAHISLFNKNSILVEYQQYNHPIYHQFGSEFLSYLGVLDLLLNEGLDKSKTIILSGRNYQEAIIKE